MKRTWCDCCVVGRCNSISDGGEGVSYDKEERDDVLREMGQGQEQGQGLCHGDPDYNTLPPHGKRCSSQDPLPMSTFKKLRRLSRSLSIGHSSHCRWKTRPGTKAGKPESPASAPPYWPYGNARNKGGMAGESYEATLSSSSSPVSPADPEQRMDKSRFAALLGEELAGHSGLWAGRAGLLTEEGCARLRSLSASCGDCDTCADEGPQTGDRRSVTRVGPVYRVDTLEVIEMEDNPSAASAIASRAARSSSPAVLNNRLSRSNTTGPGGAEQETCLDPRPVSYPSFLEKYADQPGMLRARESWPNLLRPDSFPEKLACSSPGSHTLGFSSAGFCSPVPPSPDPRSPGSRRGNAVHFSPYNEVRFVDRSNTSDTFFQQAAGPPSPNLSARNQSGPTTHSHMTAHNQPESTSQQTGCDTAGSGVGDRMAVPGQSRPRQALCVVDHERRKRIRKLQHDLRRIQRDLQDLDDLESDVTEV